MGSREEKEKLINEIQAALAEMTRMELRAVLDALANVAGRECSIQDPESPASDRSQAP